MSSSHHRSSSSRSSRPTQTNGNTQNHRSTSEPQREFVFILTNNPELLRHTRVFQPLARQQQIQATPTPARNSSTNQQSVNNNNNNNDREQLLDNLLQVELREAAQGYLSRTRRMGPILNVFNMSNIEF